MLSTSVFLHAQTADPTVAPLPFDAEKRLQWLNARVPPKPTSKPKIGFRANPQIVSTRPVETPSPAAPAPLVKTHLAEAASPQPKPAVPTPSKTGGGESRPNKATPSSLARQTPAPVTPASTLAQKLPPEKLIAKVTPKAPATSPKASPNATPKPIVQATPPPPATPRLVAKLTTPAPTFSPPPTRTRPPESTPTPPPKLPRASSLAFIPPNPPTPKPQATPSPNLPTKGRYPWKTSIVTTVFWIGEAPGGNNFTPNRSSSWDKDWTESYGGFDNPDPDARRNFIPVRFTPRQNPFYVALPYNDVTRGTTKPEARRVIPWFREAFVREGLSVCRDRWVAIRSQSGKVAYAQWSDCGPFRTDHWQYVFGSERPKPNLNKGAGLDVSPAVRDYLGLDGTDLTDWKFVDFREVPTGPWARHGSNNTFLLR